MGRWKDSVGMIGHGAPAGSLYYAAAQGEQSRGARRGQPHKRYVIRETEWG